MLLRLSGEFMLYKNIKFDILQEKQMPYSIVFYKDRKGNQPVKDFIDELSSSSGKDACVNFRKIATYINYLRYEGLGGGEPYIKHLRGEIWELRPLGNRILFAPLAGCRFVLLYVFQKKTQKTPLQEIEKAERELEDFKRRY